MLGIGLLLLNLVLMFVYKVYKKVHHFEKAFNVAEFMVEVINSEHQSSKTNGFSAFDTSAQTLGNYPAPLENYVNDFANVLNPNDSQTLRRKLQSLEAKRHSRYREQYQ